MSSRASLLVVMLLVAGVGVVAGLTFGGTAADVWVRRLLGAAMIVAGAVVFASADGPRRDISRLHAIGTLVFGVSFFVPHRSLSLAIMLAAAALMFAAAVMRRRAS